jgi:hypothetical protein
VNLESPEFILGNRFKWLLSRALELLRTEPANFLQRAKAVWRHSTDGLLPREITNAGQDRYSSK